MKFTIRQTQEQLTSQSGLALVGALLSKSGYRESINKLLMPTNRGHNIKNSDISISMIALLCQGKCDFTDIEFFRSDPFFPLSLDINKVPSSSRLRQRLNNANEQWDEVAIDASMKLLRNHAIQTTCYADYIPIDIDVSVFDNSDSNKEGVSNTYKNISGFSPIFAHIGTEGYLLNLEFREGDTHSQKGTTSFLKKTFSLLKKLPHENYLLRMDAGNDSIYNIRECHEFNKAYDGKIHIDFIIKRNLRKESKEQWLEIAKEYGSLTTPRDGKDIYIGKISRKVDIFEEPLEIVFKVINRTIDRYGQSLLIAEIEVETYWNSMDVEPDKVIELYHNHATSEQFHSELKTDIGIERLPSGYFQTNTRVMFLSLLAFNILRIMGQECLNYEGVPIVTKHRIRRRRLRSVIQDLIYLAARLITHSRQWILGFGKVSPFYDTFRYLYFKWAG